LQGESEDDLAEKGGEDFPGDEGCGGALGAESWVRGGPAHKDSDGKYEKEVDKEELLISV